MEEKRMIFSLVKSWVVNYKKLNLVKFVYVNLTIFPRLTVNGETGCKLGEKNNISLTEVLDIVDSNILSIPSLNQ